MKYYKPIHLSPNQKLRLFSAIHSLKKQIQEGEERGAFIRSLGEAAKAARLKRDPRLNNL